jgi:hypothetical protein
MQSERPMIPFQGSYTREMLQRATRLMLARFRLVPWLFGLMIPICLFGVVIVPIQHGEPARSVILTALPGFLFLTVMLVFFLRMPGSSADRLLKTNKLLQEPVEGYVSEAGIYFSTPHIRLDLSWDRLYKATATESMLLLGISDAQSTVLPREFFASDEDWRRVLAWVEANAPKPPGNRRFWRMILWMVIFVIVVLLWNFFQTGE